MGLYSIYSHLKKAEADSAQLYAFLSIKIAHKYPELAQFLKTMSEEEKIHEKRVEMYKNLFQQAQDFFIEKQDAESILLDMLKKIESIRVLFEKHGNELTPREILRIVEEMETEMEYRHHTMFVGVSDASLKQLMENLECADRAHKQGLTNFLNNYR